MNSLKPIVQKLPNNLSYLLIPKKDNDLFMRIIKYFFIMFMISRTNYK